MTLVIRNALSQSLSFPVSLDKGNTGSGNEIVHRSDTLAVYPAVSHQVAI